MSKSRPNTNTMSDKELSEFVRLQMRDEQLARANKNGNKMSAQEHDDVMAALGMPGYEAAPAKKASHHSFRALFSSKSKAADVKKDVEHKTAPKM